MQGTSHHMESCSRFCWETHKQTPHGNRTREECPPTHPGRCLHWSPLTGWGLPLRWQVSSCNLRFFPLHPWRERMSERHWTKGKDTEMTRTQLSQVRIYFLLFLPFLLLLPSVPWMSPWEKRSGIARHLWTSSGSSVTLSQIVTYKWYPPASIGGIKPPRVSFLLLLPALPPSARPEGSTNFLNSFPLISQPPSFSHSPTQILLILQTNLGPTSSVSPSYSKPYWAFRFLMSSPQSAAHATYHLMIF